jgi:hypothetical protein
MMTVGLPSIPQRRTCGRPTQTTGKPCRLSPIWFWPEAAGITDPRSCRMHLTDAESAAYAPFLAADRERSDAFVREFIDHRMRLLASDPACWSWSLPTDTEVNGYLMSFSAATREHLGDARSLYVWGPWHAGRCAICGMDSVLINDHDHQTGLRRGRICSGCNTLEGFGHGGVFGKYRERNPATICGVAERYWNPFTQEYAEPQPERSGISWAEHPMKGIGL